MTPGDQTRIEFQEAALRRAVIDGQNQLDRLRQRCGLEPDKQFYSRAEVDEIVGGYAARLAAATAPPQSEYLKGKAIQERERAWAKDGGILNATAAAAFAVLDLAFSNLSPHAEARLPKELAVLREFLVPPDAKRAGPEHYLAFDRWIAAALPRLAEADRIAKEREAAEATAAAAAAAIKRGEVASFGRSA